jgi:hypothetical protein
MSSFAKSRRFQFVVSSVVARRPPLRRWFTTASSSSSSPPPSCPPPDPTRLQMYRVFINHAVPMIGFGFTDQTIMIQAGHALDVTLGASLGLSTMTAAAFGLACSNVSGVVLGGVLERIAQRIGLPAAELTQEQWNLEKVQRLQMIG